MMERLIRLVFPRKAQCLACGELSGADEWTLCSDCFAELNESRVDGFDVCGRCGAPIAGKFARCDACKSWPQGALDKALSVYIYQYPIDRMIKLLKYGGIKMLSEFMGARLAEAVKAAGLRDFDMVIPVAMHKARLRKRWLHHSEAIASVASDSLGVPLMTAALIRTRNTRPQVKLGEKARLTNVKGAFKATPDVRGKRVLLIDDTLTTGATAINCAKALKESGAAYVCLGTIARAGMTKTSKPFTKTSMRAMIISEYKNRGKLR